MEVCVQPPGFPRAREIGGHVRDAAAHVGLDDRVVVVELVFDAPEFEEAGYWDVDWLAPGRAHVTLYGSARDVLVRPAAGEVGPEAWGRDFDELESLGDERLDLLRLDRWLHRNLLQLDDILRRRVRPTEIPSEIAAGLQACWDVWTDGRLRHWQHPGLSQAERRRVFYRVFATRGLLLPRHWEAFHELWEGHLPDQEGLLAALARLPRP